MSKTLIICEKGRVASAVAQALAVGHGNNGVWENADLIVAAARGHLLELAPPAFYDARYAEWHLEDLPIIPTEFKFQANDDGQELLSKLHGLIGRTDVTAIVNACDAAREGELIFKTILRTAPVGSEKPVRRAWFASLTYGAIRAAFENLRPDEEMQGLESAAFARAQSDWLVGINCTRAAAVRSGVRNATLSVGRVQTPTLAVLVEREQEINAYVPVPWHRIEMTIQAPAGSVQLVSELMEDSNVAQNSAASLTPGQRVAISASAEEEITLQPPLPFDLTELQAAASRRYKMTAEKTLEVAQDLYESGLISYPRTDSRFLTGDLLSRMGDIFQAIAHHVPDLSELAGKAAAMAAAHSLPTRCVNNNQVRDHHAIIPTDKSGASLTGNEARIYELIARRTLAAFAEPARIHKITVAANAGKVQVSTKGEQWIEKGWTVIEPRQIDSTAFNAVASLVATGGGTLQQAVVKERCKPRPDPHTDATLLAAMVAAGRPEGMPPYEWRGIGTPATRAATIERLIKHGLAERQENFIVASDIGYQLIGALQNAPLTDASLTAIWEKRLADIESGASRQQFDNDIEAFVREQVRSVIESPLQQLTEYKPLGSCPRCHTPVTADKWRFCCDNVRNQNGNCDFVVWRWRTDNRIGRAEAIDRIQTNRPHKTVNHPILPPAESKAGWLVDYAAWEPHPIATEEIDNAILEIVGIEQPVLVRRITRLVKEAKNMTHNEARHLVNRRTAALVAQRKLVEQIESNEPGQQPKVARLPETPEIQVRARGSRDIEEIPLGELREIKATYSEVCDALDLPADDERVRKRLQAAEISVE
jgi:DNA topoisomerase-3